MTIIKGEKTESLLLEYRILKNTNNNNNPVPSEEKILTGSHGKQNVGCEIKRVNPKFAQQRDSSDAGWKNLNSQQTD